MLKKMLHVAVWRHLGALCLKLDVNSKKENWRAGFVASSKNCFPLAATRGLTLPRDPDGRILSPEPRWVKKRKKRGKRCTSRRWPQLLGLAWATRRSWPEMQSSKSAVFSGPAWASAWDLAWDRRRLGIVDKQQEAQASSHSLFPSLQGQFLFLSTAAAFTNLQKA